MLLVPMFTMGAETLVSQAPNDRFAIYALGEPAPKFRVVKGQRIVGDSPPSEVVLEFRDSNDQKIHEIIVTLPPVSAVWSPDSKHVIIHGHGYRSHHSHQLYAVASEGVTPISIDQDAFGAFLSKDSRPAAMREWDASLSDPPFPFARKKWIFAPIDWTPDGLLRIGATELARDPEQPHPFQQQVCSYILQVDVSREMRPVRLTATSQEHRSKHEVIWEKDRQ